MQHVSERNWCHDERTGQYLPIDDEDDEITIKKERTRQCTNVGCEIAFCSHNVINKATNGGQIRSMGRQFNARYQIRQ